MLYSSSERSVFSVDWFTRNGTTYICGGGTYKIDIFELKNGELPKGPSPLYVLSLSQIARVYNHTLSWRSCSKSSLLSYFVVDKSTAKLLLTCVGFLFALVDFNSGLCIISRMPTHKICLDQAFGKYFFEMHTGQGFCEQPVRYLSTVCVDAHNQCIFFSCKFDSWRFLS